MRLVIDTNILFSALLKPSSDIARFLIQPGDFELYAPEFLLEELKSKEAKIAGLTGLHPMEIQGLTFYILERVKLISLKEVNLKTLQVAHETVRDIDQNDFAFVALTAHL